MMLEEIATTATTLEAPLKSAAVIRHLAVARTSDEVHWGPMKLEKLALLGQLAAGVTHELNNPLAFVKSNADFLSEELAEREDIEPDLRAALADLRLGLDRIVRVVTDLRAFTREERDEALDASSVGDLVAQAQRMAFFRLGTIQVVCTIPEPVRRLTVRGRLGQVLVGLMVNAADALEAAETPSPEIRIDVSATASHVQIVIEDNGPGIAPEAMSLLFAPALATRAPGGDVGLGLSLARRYVELCNGTLRAENVPSRGARFVIEVPSCQDLYF